MADLIYGSAPNGSRGAPAFPYIYESGIGWRPYKTSDIAAAAEISVSGLSVTVSGIDELRTLQESGNEYLKEIKNNTSPYLKSSSTQGSLVQSFNAYSGRCIVSKINGFSRTTFGTNYIQIFDNNSQTGFPIANLLVDSGNNFFYSFDGGVVFDNGITIASSADPFSPLSGSNDFFSTVFYKPYPA